MTKIAFLAALSLACSTPASARDSDATYTSAKSPAELAICILEKSKMWMVSVKPMEDGGGVSVLGKNNLGMTLARWDIYETPTGSIVEFRAKLWKDSGRRKAEGCI